MDFNIILLLSGLPHSDEVSLIWYLPVARRLRLLPSNHENYGVSSIKLTMIEASSGIVVNF
jgi:hypothetical protein